jgi:hypothetical protein
MPPVVFIVDHLNFLPPGRGAMTFLFIVIAIPSWERSQEILKYEFAYIGQQRILSPVLFAILYLVGLISKSLRRLTHREGQVRSLFERWANRVARFGTKPLQKYIRIDLSHDRDFFRELK